MEEPKTLNPVQDFHRLFNHPVLDSPQIPDEKRCKLRVSLLEEEVKEFADAIRNKNIVEVADALADIQYVLAGAILEFGLGDKFAAIFREVQRSNMSKAATSQEEADATIRFNRETKGEECYSAQTGGKFLIYRSSDNKTVKSINYSPASLAPIVFAPDTAVEKVAIITAG